MASLPKSPIAGIQLPHTELVQKAYTFVNEHCIPSTTSHCLRSAIFALIIAAKVPRLGHVGKEDIVVAALLHDLGWSESATLRSQDKRFEVDGANAAREFLRSQHGDAWTEQRVQQLWDAIALHATPSIAMHAQAIVAAVCWGITADFTGPHTPGEVISVDEFREVLKAYPRIGFLGETTEILCGLCRTKPETTYDNFVGDFGRAYVDGYREEWEKKRTNEFLASSLRACEQFET